MGSIPGQGTKILHALWCGQEKEVKHTKYKQMKKDPFFFISQSLFPSIAYTILEAIPPLKCGSWQEHFGVALSCS